MLISYNIEHTINVAIASINMVYRIHTSLREYSRV